MSFEHSGSVEDPTRRSFIKKLAATAGFGLLAVGASGTLITLLEGCSSQPSGSGMSWTSSIDAGHAHSLFIPDADIESMPASKTYSSSNFNDHTHDVTMTRTDFEALNNGQTVTKTGTATGTPVHPHTWTLVL